MPAALADYLHSVHISSDLNRRIDRWLAAAQPYDYGPDPARYEAALRPHLAEFPEELARIVSGFGDRLGSAGALYLRGLPIPDSLPPTPAVHPSSVRRPVGTEPLVLGLALLAGRLFSLRGPDGWLSLENVYPLRELAEVDQHSNVMRLGLHMDQPFSEECDGIVLFCLRDGLAPRPASQMCDLRRVWAELDDADRSRLAEPAFCIPIHEPDGTKNLMAPNRVVTEWRGQLRFHYIPDLAGATPDDDDLLRHVNGIIDRFTIQFTMTPGDVLIIDNTHLIHGRDRQSPGFGGDDRWLQKCFLSARERGTPPKE